MRKQKLKTIVKIIKCSQEQAWYSNKIGKRFQTLGKEEHHQGSHHGYIYVCINPEYGWIFAKDVKVIKNNLWNRLFGN